MKKLNKKGFTLIELLAVVVILLVIAVIAISSISASIERNKAKQNKAKIEVIENYAQTYYNEHKNSLKNATQISLGDLNLNESETLDADGEKICGYVKINSNKTLEFVEDENYCNY